MCMSIVSSYFYISWAKLTLKLVSHEVDYEYRYILKLLLTFNVLTVWKKQQPVSSGIMHKSLQVKRLRERERE